MYGNRNSANHNFHNHTKEISGCVNSQVISVNGSRKLTRNLSDMRSPYLGKADVFTEDQLVSKEPLEQFNQWFELALDTPGIEEPNAMSLATATKNGRPSVRMVLLKGYGAEGFKFFTNYESRKGRELMENPYAALNIFWEPLKRCIRIEGRVERLSEAESTEYFHSRPIGNQIGATISPQSQPIENRDELHKLEKEMIAQNMESIPKPNNWGGFTVIPTVMEFWQGQTNRIHDRIRFRRPEPEEVIDNKLVHQGENGWVYERLGP